MSIFYSQSNKPRCFEYLNNPTPMSIEHVQSTRRVESTRSSIQSLNTFMNYGLPYEKKSNSSKRALPDSKRTIVPEMNNEKERPQSKKVEKNIQSYTPGSMQSFLERTGDDNKKFDAQRKIQPTKILKESISEDMFAKRVLKPCPLKVNYDYYTQITTLPISPCINQNIKEKPIIHKKSVSSISKLACDMYSSIEGLPGTLRSRNTSIDKLSDQKIHTIDDRCKSIYPHTANSSAQKNDNIQAENSTLFKKNINSDQNQKTNAGFFNENKGLDNMKKIIVNDQNYSNSKAIKQKFLANSYDENNAPIAKVNRQRKSIDLFKSYFQIN